MNSLDEQFGYDANFISDVADSLKCIVCHLVMRQPVQIMTCGHRFCKPCFERLQGYSTHLNTELCCPIDRDAIDMDKVFDDTAVSRDIGNLQVTCSYVAFGCSWKGDLRNLMDHEKECQHQINQKIDNQNQVASYENMGLVAELLKRVQSCENNLNIKQKDLAHVRYDIHEMERKYSEKENEVASLKTLNEEIRREMDESKKINEELKECFESKIETLERRNEELEIRIELLDAQAKEDTNIMTGKFELLETQIKDNEMIVTDYKESLVSKEQLESLKAVVTKDIKLLETRVETNRTTIKEYKDKSASKKQLENFKTNITNKLKEKQLLPPSNSVLPLTEINFKDVTKKMEFLQTQIRTNETTIKGDHFKSEIETLEKRNEKLENRIELLEAHVKADTNIMTGKFELLETQIKDNEMIVTDYKESLVSKEQLESLKAVVTKNIELLETRVETNRTTIKECKDKSASKKQLENFKTNITNKLKEKQLLPPSNSVLPLTEINFKDVTKKIEFLQTQIRAHHGLFASKEEHENFQADIHNEIEFLQTQIKANEMTLREQKQLVFFKEEHEKFKVEMTNEVESLRGQIKLNKKVIHEYIDESASKEHENSDKIYILTEEYRKFKAYVIDRFELHEVFIKKNETTLSKHQNLFDSKQANKDLKALITNQTKISNDEINSLKTNITEWKESLDFKVEYFKTSLESQIKANETTLRVHHSFYASKEEQENFQADVYNEIESLETQIKANKGTLKEHKESFVSKEANETFKTDVANKIKSLLTHQNEANKSTLNDRKESSVSKVQYKEFKADVTNEIGVNETSPRGHEQSFTSKEANRNLIEDITNKYLSFTSDRENNPTTQVLTNDNDDLSQFKTRLESLEKLYSTFRKNTIRHLQNIENIRMFCDEPSCKEKNIKFKWVITNYQSKRDLGERIYSPIFYDPMRGFHFKIGVAWWGMFRVGLHLIICSNDDAVVEQDEERKFIPDSFPHDLEIQRRDGSSIVKSFLASSSFETLTSFPIFDELKWNQRSLVLDPTSWDDYIINDMMYITCTLRTEGVTQFRSRNNTSLFKRMFSST